MSFSRWGREAPARADYVSTDRFDNTLRGLRPSNSSHGSMDWDPRTSSASDFGGAPLFALAHEGRIEAAGRGKIYIIRAIERKPAWETPGWGVYLEGIWFIHPDIVSEWPIHPKRFRPVVNRPTKIEIFMKLLAVCQPSGP
jgi:hypothetical protein